MKERRSKPPAPRFLLRSGERGSGSLNGLWIAGREKDGERMGGGVRVGYGKRRRKRGKGDEEKGLEGRGQGRYGFREEGREGKDGW